MIENEFYTVVTTSGIIAEANAHAEKKPTILKQIAVGDAEYEPDGSETSLQNERFRIDLNTLYQDPKNPSWLVAEAILPADIGGFWIREVGIFTDDGTLYAIAKYPPTYKPSFDAGANKTLYIRMIFEVSNSANVTLMVDDSVTTATREDMLKLQGEISELMKRLENASLEARGIVQLSSAINSTSEEKAATSLAVKKAYDLAKSANDKSLPPASTGAAGIVKLNDAVNSNSITEAATANAVKKAYELANTANNKNPAAASITAPGIVKLNNTVSSTSVAEAATANAVRVTYELATNGLNNANTAWNLANNANSVAQSALSSPPGAVGSYYATLNYAWSSKAAVNPAANATGMAGSWVLYSSYMIYMGANTEAMTIGLFRRVA